VWKGIPYLVLEVEELLEETKLEVADEVPMSIKRTIARELDYNT
jgi:hypothetical protein